MIEKRYHYKRHNVYCVRVRVPNNLRNIVGKDFPKIYLIDGSQLVKMLLKFNVGFLKKNKNYYADITFFNELVRIVEDTRKNKEKIFLNIEYNRPYVIN